MGRVARILLACWGSLGDLHPYLAVACRLRARGHSAAIAAPAMYRAKVEGEGIEFHPLAPDLAPYVDDPEALRRSFHPRTGTEFVVREMVLRHVEESRRDVFAASEGAALIVGHPLAYAVPIVAEQRGIPWLSTVLAPLGFLSTYDAPFVPGASFVYPLRHLGRWPFALLFKAARKQSRSWAEPLVELRRSLGLGVPDMNLIIDGMFSPYGVMAWFSRAFSGPQPDWPPRTRITGFPFYDRLEPGRGLPPALEEFLAAGEPPIVFTLGSAAILDAGTFYRESAAAAARLGRRAVLLTGPDGRNDPGALPAGIIAADYAPFSELFPRAAATVHQGGIGTTAQALRAGRPMLVVPFAHDQPDNARRVKRLGCGDFLDRSKYRAARAAAALDSLLADRDCAARAAEVGRAVRAEDGAGAACDVIETELRR
jgi:UDP:flavonoid glycosyltransferase YjiC (YdhE family)